MKIAVFPEDGKVEVEVGGGEFLDVIRSAVEDKVREVLGSPCSGVNLVSIERRKNRYILDIAFDPTSCVE